MSVRDAIEAKLRETFAPSLIEVTDESDRHRGHAGWREGGGTHFRVTIASSHFDGMSRLAQHRAVMTALDDQFEAGMHALNIKVVQQ